MLTTQWSGSMKGRPEALGEGTTCRVLLRRIRAQKGGAAGLEAEERSFLRPTSA